MAVKNCLLRCVSWWQTTFLRGLARIFHELSSRGRKDGRATGQPQGVGPEAYLNSTSQGELVLSVVEGTSEDARKDGHIIRARCAPLSPASGFPVSKSQQVIHEISGLEMNREVL